MATADVGIRIMLQDGAGAGFNALAGSLRGFNGLLGQLAYGWQSLSGPMQMAGITAAGSGLLFAGFVSAIKYCTDAASQLEDAMVKVENNVDGAGQHMSQLQTIVTNLADNSVFSTTQIADGFAELGDHGITAADIINTKVGLAMVNLATVTGSQTVPAADLLTSCLQMFNLKASDATTVADGLAYSFSHGVNSLSQMQGAYNQFAPLAAQLNVSFQDSTAVLDVLNQKFNDGSVSGTALKYILKSFVAPTVQATNEFAAMGIITTNKTNPALKSLQAELEASGNAGAAVSDAFNSSGGTVKTLQNLFNEAQKLGLIKMDTTFTQWGQSTGILNDKLYDAKGNFIGLNNSLQLLSGSMKGLDPAQVATAVENMFSKTGAKGALDLLNNYSALAPKIQAIIDGLNKQGTAQQKADQIQDTYSGRLKQLQTTFQSLAADIGGPLSTGFKNFYFVLNNVLSWFANMPSPVHAGIALFLVLGAVIAGLTFIVSVAIFAFGTMGTILLPVMGIIALIVGVIAALAIGIYLLVTHWKQVTQFMAPVGKMFQQMGGWIMAFLTPIGKVIGGSLVASFQALWKSISSMLIPAFQALHPFITAFQVLFQVLGFLGKWLAIIVGVILGCAFVLVGGLIGGVCVAIGRVFLGLGVAISGVVLFIVGILNVLMGIFRMIGGVILILVGQNQLGTKLLGAGWQEFVNGFKQLIQGMCTAVFGLLYMLVGGIIGFFKGLWNTIVGLIMSLSDKLVGHSIIPDMCNAILAVFKMLWNVGVAIFNAMVTAFLFPFKLFAMLVNLEIQGVIVVFHLLWSGAQAVWNGIVIIFNGIKNCIISAMNAVITPIQNVLGVLGHLTNIGGSIGGLAHSLHIPGFASGGLVTQPTLAMIGEGGEHELVMPVSKLIQASQAAAGQGQGGGMNVVNLQLDGKNFLQVFIDQATGQARLAGATRLFK